MHICMISLWLLWSIWSATIGYLCPFILMTTVKLPIWSHSAPAYIMSTNLLRLQPKQTSNQPELENTSWRSGVLSKSINVKNPKEFAVCNQRPGGNRLIKSASEVHNKTLFIKWINDSNQILTNTKLQRCCCAWKHTWAGRGYLRQLQWNPFMHSCCFNSL